MRSAVSSRYVSFVFVTGSAWQVDLAEDEFEEAWKAACGFSPPNESEKRLVRLIGARDAFALFEALGGTRVYVPSTARQTTLSDVISPESIACLGADMGGDYFRVPLARWFRACYWRLKGESYSKIARRLGVGETGIDKMFSGAHIEKGTERPPALTGESSAS